MDKFTALARMAPVVPTQYGGLVSMNALYDSNSDEHRKFAEATPVMNVNMVVKKSLIDEI